MLIVFERAVMGGGQEGKEGHAIVLMKWRSHRLKFQSGKFQGKWQFCQDFSKIELGTVNTTSNTPAPRRYQLSQWKLLLESVKVL